MSDEIMKHPVAAGRPPVGKFGIDICTFCGFPVTEHRADETTGQVMHPVDHSGDDEVSHVAEVPTFCPHADRSGPSGTSWYFTAEELAQVSSRPLCCTKCGQELELRCGNGHVHRAPRSPRGKDTNPRTYKPRPCECGATFTPTGPRDSRCPTCKAVARSGSPIEQRRANDEASV